MSFVSGFAIFKKKSGVLAIYEEKVPPILQWKAADGASSIPVVEIVLSTITSLKATPATSDQMKLKILVSQAEGSEPLSFMFTFNNRIVMDNVKETLTHIVARYKNASQVDSKNSTNTVQEKPLINTTFLTDALDTKQLLKNHELQQKLLINDKALMSTFQEAVIKQGLAPDEFWSTRVHLLRAFALTNSQKKGPYNVLSTIKPTATSDNQVNVSVTKEKIHTIFEQYPVVRKAYDDNVPRLSEGEFWSRFFSSKLFIKLRGEKLGVNVRGDFILDKYIDMDIDYEKHEDEQLNHPVNKTIDLEGNLADDSTKLGNAPDITMKPNAVPETVSVLRSMNRLSEKIVNSLEHEYSRQATPEEQKSKEELENERVRTELLFRDLETPHLTEYSEIKVKQDNERIVKKPKTATKEEYIAYSKELERDLTPPFDLRSIFSENRKPFIEKASQEVLNAVYLSSKQSKQSWQIFRTFEEQQTFQVTDEIDPNFDLKLLEQLRITHATSIEFLRHFWLHYNSGDPSQAGNVRTLYNSLLKSQERIKASLDQIHDPEVKQQSYAFLEPLTKSLSTAMNQYVLRLKEEEATQTV